jgi:hypothetical protein
LQTAKDARDFGNLGKTLGALAITEDARGHGDATNQLRRDAMRYLYLAGDVDGITVSYHDLGNYFHLYARQPTAAFSCHLAAALISALAGTGGTGDSVHNASIDLRELGAAVLPVNVADLCRQLGDIPGTDLPRLIAAISPDPAAAEQNLRTLIAQAQALAELPDEADPPLAARPCQKH